MPLPRAQQCDQLPVPAQEDHPGFVDERCGVARAASTVRRRIATVANVDGIEGRLGQRKREPRKRVREIVPTAFAKFDDALFRDPALVAKRGRVPRRRGLEA